MPERDQHPSTAEKRLIPTWAAVPLVFLLIPLSVLLIPFLVPYAWLYPDRSQPHFHAIGTRDQRTRYARWQAMYDHLGFAGRIRRAWLMSCRRRRR